MTDGADAVRTFKAVVIDIDGTLTAADSLTATSAELGMPVEELVRLSYGCHTGQIPYAQARHLLLERWSASGPVSQTRLDTLFHRLPLRPDAPHLIERVHALGLPVALVSSSMSLYARIVADRLGVGESYANVQLSFDANGILADLSFTLDTVGLKHRQLLDFCSRHHLLPGEVMAIGDADNDVALFTATGNGVLLAEEAVGDLADRAWQVVPTLTRAAELLLTPGSHPPRPATPGQATPASLDDHTPARASGSFRRRAGNP
jgi:HAD superfamily phosphoserine phosphatase-like hydrolase